MKGLIFLKLVLVSSKNHQQSILKNLLSTLCFAETKKIGSVGCKVASILRGEADVYISLSGKTSPKDWDMAAPHALIEAAGGIFSHADGTNLIYQKNKLFSVWLFNCKPWEISSKDLPKSYGVFLSRRT